MGNLSLCTGCLPALFALFLFALSPRALAETWEELEERGSRIEGLDIRAQDVFDLEDPRENHAAGRLANFVHIRTREGIVAREVLFSEGDPVAAALVRETERNLRALGWIADAYVLPRPGSDGGVRALVVTEDAWSLKGGLKFRFEGGDTEWGVDVEEFNLLGLGKALRLGYEDTKERKSWQAGYRDPRLLGSRWQLRASYEDLSDGRRRRLSLRRPFFALETKWAALASVFAEESSVRFYDLGDEAIRIPSQFDEARVGFWRAFTLARRSVLRMGVEYRLDEAVYDDPVTVRESGLPDPGAVDRDLGGIFLAVQYLEDRHFVAENLISIGRTEDLNEGWNIRGAAGIFREELGGGENAAGAELDAVRLWRLGRDAVLRAGIGAEGRYREGGWEETRVDAAAAVYDQRLPSQTLAARAAFSGGNRLAPESWIYIGAGDGLRGYPSDYRAGDRRWVIGVEDRIVTDRVFWGMAQLGFVVFADAGQIRRLDTGEWSRVYADAGGGLRIGNLKSAFGRVVLATIAFPLVDDDGVNDFEVFAGTGFSF